MSDKKYLFSQEMRDALAPFEKMTTQEALGSVDFMRALCLHAGMSKDEFNKILDGDDEDEDEE